MDNKILIYDQNDLCRETFKKILDGYYFLEQVNNVSEIMNITSNNPNDTIVLLIDMLDSANNGLALLEELSKSPLYGKLPIIIVCNPTSVDMEEKLFSYEISECIRQPLNDRLIRLKINNVFKLFQYQKQLEEKIQQQTMRLELQNKMLKMEADFLHKSNLQIIELLGAMAEHRNQESGEHIQRVKEYTRIIAEELMKEYPEKGLTHEKIDIIVSASALHDIGKIAITDTVLLKPGKLTDKEFDYIKSHTINGCEILENLKNAWSKEFGSISMDICRYHHERYDGNGYPDGLKGDEIPISAQLVAIADVYDALVHERVYKAAIPKDEAYKMIMNGECGIFSPQLLKCLTKCRKKMELL